MKLRVGQGYDVHRLRRRDGSSCWAARRSRFDRGLEGHSDADVLLHALGDALLGAAGLGDLGDHFPPSDPHWRDARSVRPPRADRRAWCEDEGWRGRSTAT